MRNAPPRIHAAFILLFAALFTVTASYAQGRGRQRAGERRTPPPAAGVTEPERRPPPAEVDAGPPGPTTAELAAQVPEIHIPLTDAEKAEGANVIKIELSGNRRVSRDDVMAYVREKIGAPFRVDALATDVRSLWDANFFDDIEVDLSRSDPGVSLRFIVHERPNIKAIEYVGNEEIENDKLQEAIELKPNTILSLPAVNRSIQKIKDAYAEKGYFLADVEKTIEPQKDNEVTVKFKVTEHQPVTVRRVSFIGNHSVSDDELRAQMQTGDGGLLAFGSGGPYRQDAFERDVIMLNALYYDRGFMNVQIGTPRVMLTPDREGIDITIIIHEGPRFKIRQLKVLEQDLDGKEVEPIDGRKALRSLIAAHSGDYFNRAQIVKQIEAVTTSYKDHGYANVEASPQIELDPVHQQVDVVIPVKRGPLVHVERIEIKGNTKTRDTIIRREVVLEETQTYSASRVELSKRRITALGYFERVDVSTEQGSAPDKIILHFEVAERPTGTFQVGAGFSSVESFIGTAQIQQANFLGNGQNVSLNAQVSSLRRLITARFLEPYFLNSAWSFSLEAFDTVYVFPTFSQTSVGGTASFGYALIQPILRFTVAASVHDDTVNTATTTLLGGSTLAGAYQRLPLANLFNAGLTASIRPTLTFDTRDNRLFPSSGLLLQGSTEFANADIGSQVQFIRHQAAAKVYIPLGMNSGGGNKGFVLKWQTNAGLITSPSSEGVPVFARYFLGGIMDVRGFRLRTIGPRLPLNQSLDVNAPPIPNGAPIGGNLEIYQNLEVEFPILDAVGIRGVAFFDAGNAWNTEQQFCSTTPAPQFSKLVSPCFNASSLTYLRTSVGFGVRWFSPLGPLRFEWGFPLAPLPYETHSDFQFTIGNFF